MLLICVYLIFIRWINNFPARVVVLSILQKLSRKETVWLQQEAEKRLPGGFELTPTHGQVHIPMSTKAAEMCLHATPTVS